MWVTFIKSQSYSIGRWGNYNQSKMTLSVWRQSSKPLKMALVEMFTKGVLFISYIAIIPNIQKFNTLEEAIEVMQHSTHSCVTTFVQWSTTRRPVLAGSPADKWTHNRLFHGTMGCLCSGKMHCSYFLKYEMNLPPLQSHVHILSFTEKIWYIISSSTITFNMFCGFTSQNTTLAMPIFRSICSQPCFR